MTMQQNPAVKPNYGYYRQPDGRVTLSPANDLDELKYSRMGWTALRQYGKFEATSPYVANHPLEGLFLAGGAKELSLEQITVQGFHVDPPTGPRWRTAANAVWNRGKRSVALDLKQDHDLARARSVKLALAAGCAVTSTNTGIPSHGRIVAVTATAI